MVIQVGKLNQSQDCKDAGKSINLRSGNLGGPAAKFHGDKLGSYVSTGSERNGRTVYRRRKGKDDGGLDAYLHFNDWGRDLVRSTGVG